MVLALLVCSLVLVSAVGQQANNDWVDPYDMLHYDSTSKTMRKPTEIEEQKKKISLLSGQPTCNPVFKRFLTRLLKEMQKVGLPTDSSDAFYDAKVVVSKQAITEIQTLLDGDGSFTTGTLDTAISQILVDLKPHDYDACKRCFEDSFGVELETLLMIRLCVLVMMLIICTQLWSTLSWFVLFTGLFAVGQGISEFFQNHLKDVLVTLQILILVFVCASVQAAFMHGITAPPRQQGPPPPGLQQPQQQP